MDYLIERTVPTIYLDELGSAVNGYRVTFTIPEFGEKHYVQVPNIRADTVRAAIEERVAQRKALSDLSGEQ